MTAQFGVDLFHLAGTDDHLEQATGEERPLDQVNLVQRGAVDQARVLEGQAQPCDTVRGLLEVVAAAEALQQLGDDVRIVVAHA
ncbi:hypothetical protein D3C86_1812900 [compost metagenome]